MLQERYEDNFYWNWFDDLGCLVSGWPFVFSLKPRGHSQSCWSAGSLSSAASSIRPLALLVSLPFQTDLCSSWICFLECFGGGHFWLLLWLPFFLLFLRLFPMSPNWALNMASGVLGVPIHLFFISVLVGLMPYNYLCVTSGAILSEINDLGDIVSWSNMAR